MGIANGTDATLHCLIFLNKDDRELVERGIANTPLGSVYKLHKPPDYVIVQMDLGIHDSVNDSLRLNLENQIPASVPNNFYVPLHSKLTVMAKKILNSAHQPNPQKSCLIVSNMTLPMPLLVTSYRDVLSNIS